MSLLNPKRLFFNGCESEVSFSPSSSLVTERNNIYIRYLLEIILRKSCLLSGIFFRRRLAPFAAQIKGFIQHPILIFLLLKTRLKKNISTTLIKQNHLPTYQHMFRRSVLTQPRSFAPTFLRAGPLIFRTDTVPAPSSTAIAMTPAKSFSSFFPFMVTHVWHFGWCIFFLKFPYSLCHGRVAPLGVVIRIIIVDFIICWCFNVTKFKFSFWLFTS